MKKGAIAYWLLPEKSERELFCQIIRIFCHELDAPKFEPHLTLLVSERNRPTPKAVLRCLKAEPVRLRIRATATSSKFTKTLFVRFRSDGALEKLVSDLSTAAKVRPSRLRDPHVSLLYKKTSARATRELASTLKFPFRDVVFDSIVAVRLRLPVRARADVEGWRIVARKSLRG